MGSLDTPNETFLIESLPPESSSNVNSSIILHTVDDVLRQLGTKPENFALLLTDVARYMSLAGKTSKKLHPASMHFTCIAHLLHNWAIRVCAFFKNTDDVVATIKATTIKNKNRKNDFREAGLLSPPVLWLHDGQLGLELHYNQRKPCCCSYHCQQLNRSRSLSQPSKSVINEDGLVPDLVRTSQYRTLATNVELLEASNCTMTEAYELLKNMHCLDNHCSI